MIASQSQFGLDRMQTTKASHLAAGTNAEVIACLPPPAPAASPELY